MELEDFMIYEATVYRDISLDPTIEITKSLFTVEGNFLDYDFMPFLCSILKQENSGYSSALYPEITKPDDILFVTKEIHNNTDYGRSPHAKFWILFKNRPITIIIKKEQIFGENK